MRPMRMMLGLGLLFLAAQVYAGEVFYLHTDALGSVVVVTDENANVVDRRVYEPYGLPQTPIADGPGYTGHDMDGESGLVYMQQRYYDPMVGAFLSVDPIDVNSIAGGGFNRYSYAANNPYSLWDPFGLCPARSRQSTCIEAPGFDENRSSGNTIEASPTTTAAMIENAAAVAVGDGADETLAFIVRSDSGESLYQPEDVATKTDSNGWSASADVPANATAVLHGHVTESGMMDKSGIGDAGPLREGLPNGAVSSDGIRVGVTELVNGRLQFRMVKGRMTDEEIRMKRSNLSAQQELFYESEQ